MEKRLINAGALLFLLQSIVCQANAQCPPSREPGLHVVQKGETLYSISRKHKVPVPEICLWNNRSQTDILSECTELYIKKPGQTNRSEASQPDRARQTPPIKTEKPYTKQDGGNHTVRPGETVAGIARLYGYTEEHFRNFNMLVPGMEAKSDQILRSSDCYCENAQRVVHSYVLPAGQDPLPLENPGAPVNQNISNRPGQASGNLPADPKTNASGGQNLASATSKNTALPPGETTDMNAEELSMLAEINLLRNDPLGYVKHVEEYVNFMKKNGEFGDSFVTCRELIDELKKTPSLSTLKTSQCVYQAAKKHGEDNRLRGRNDHRGSDGSWPWDRILKACPNLEDGNENLVSGPSDIRRLVMLLLVDDGIEGRGHRKTLLNPAWQYAACYKTGQVGSMPNSWVQEFAYGTNRNNERSNTKPANDLSNLSRPADAANAGSTSSANPPAKSSGGGMSADELSMVDEINLLRSNPAGYIKYVEEFIATQQKNGNAGATPAAKELIGELQKTPRLSVLEPSECVFRTAKKHAENQRPRGNIDHQGTDGSWPWDRIKRECSGMTDGNENIVGGPAEIRRAVLYLLVDDGIDSRGHRRTLLNPAWKYVGCYKAGQVGSMPNCWVQNFGY